MSNYRYICGNYFPFGMGMMNRSMTAEEYRYGYQNQEEDDELWGGAVSYKYRIEDPRLGRFFSVDPLAPKYPHNSQYAFSENRILDAIELEGLEVFLIHGTKMSSAVDMFDQEAKNEFLRIGGNKVVDDGFSWGDKSGLTNSRCSERKESAEELVSYVLEARKRLIAENKIDANEPITLVGYSHGGNIAIQAAEDIAKQTGVQVQIITYATPAYNDASAEDPAAQNGISGHIHLFSAGDGVDSIAGGSETYSNEGSNNYERPSSVQPHNGTIDTHTEMGSKTTNSGLGAFLRDNVGQFLSLKKMSKTKNEESCKVIERRPDFRHK